MNIKIKYTQKTKEEILVDFQGFLGNGCFRDVYKHNTENLVIKFPNFGERDYPNPYYDYDDSGECTLIDPSTDTDEFVFPYIAITKDHRGVWYYHAEDYKCIESEAEATLKEAMIYMNCPEEYRIALCPVIELGFTKNNIPYLIMEYCENIFDDWIYEEQGRQFLETTNREVHEVCCDNEEVLFNATDSPIDIMGDFLEIGDEMIRKIKEAFLAVMDLFNLSYWEQINHYANLGFSTSGRIYMTDYNEL